MLPRRAVGVMGVQEPFEQEQAKDQEMPPPPVSTHPFPQFHLSPQSSWFLSARPGSCPELEQGGHGARSRDKFMFWLQLHWPHAKSPVWHTYVPLPLEPGET